MKQSGAATLTLTAYEQIRNGILEGTYPLGSPLTRRRLSEVLRMSPIPVAQALQRLEAEGFVESLPRVGTRVKVPSPAEVKGHYVVREALEAQAARLFAEKATAAQRRQLLREATRLDRLFAEHFSGNAGGELSRQVHLAHMNFHMRIAEATGCEVLVQAIRNSQVLLFNWRYTLLRREPLPSGWHRQLAEVLAAGDIEEADRAMRRHVRLSMEEVVQYFEELAGVDEQGRLSYRGPQRRRRQPARFA